MWLLLKVDPGVSGKQKEGEGLVGRGLDLGGIHLILSQISPPKLLSAPGCIFKYQIGLPYLFTLLRKLKNQEMFSRLF